MDYAALPPEINSGRMYAGPGAGPMMAASAAWAGLAAELRITASAYASVVSGLTSGPWQGPASAAMAAAAAPYVTWMSSTAAQAAQAATQASAAAGAYETAFAATVPPPAVAANRAQLASLEATNIFGQNTAAIAATEAHYAEMWAQDAAAMYHYAGSSAAASRVTPFSSPPPTTEPGGLLSQAFATPVGPSAQLSQVIAGVPSALQSLATITGSQAVSSISAAVELIPKLILPANDALISVIFGVAMQAKILAGAPAVAMAASGEAGALTAGLGSGGAGSTVSAAVARAGVLGGLSVPPSWAASTPAIRTLAAVLSGAGQGAVPAAAVGHGGLLGGMALAGVAGSVLGSAAPRTLSGTGARGRTVSLKDSPSPESLQRIVAELAQKPESVQHWHTDAAKLESLLAELSRKPGVHAVHVSKGDQCPR